MAFHFKKKESPTKAARRLSRERIGRAREHLRHCDRLEAVHSVRKEIKKVRATLGLVRERVDGDVYRKCLKTLRAATKRLRDPRDTHVLPQALERLAAHFKDRLPARAFCGIKEILRQNCLEASREFRKSGSVAAVDGMLRKLNRRAKDLKVKADSWTAIRSGLSESYSRGQEAFEEARRETSPENLHQWRKRVQDLWHQLRLLCPIRPEKLGATANEMKTLSQHLGDDHDLVILRQFVSRRCARKCPGEVRLLNELMELRQKELRSTALALGSRLYAEKPSQFCRRLKNYWRAWRTDNKSG